MFYIYTIHIEFIHEDTDFDFDSSYIYEDVYLVQYMEEEWTEMK